MSSARNNSTRFKRHYTIFKGKGFALVSTLIMLLLISSSAYSATTVTTTGGAQTMVPNQATVIVDFGVTVVNDAGDITSGKVSITNGFVSGSDTLSWTNAFGITGSYNGTTGILTFTGTTTPSNWQTIFRGVGISTTSSSATARTVAFTIGSAIPYSGNGHFYEYISTAGSWTASKAAATASTLFGLQGYLATITSQAENDFIQQKLGADAWIGASDEYTEINAATGAATYANQAAAEGHWYWVTGPVGEIGTNFSNGSGSPVVVTYMNWNAGEPNNWGPGEYYGEIYSSAPSSGKWNDLPNTNIVGYVVDQGYVVEYGGMAGDPSVTLTASKTVDVAYTLTANKAGTGTGTVASDVNGIEGNGINCGADCSETYNSGTAVTLSAVAGADSTFAGWSGGTGSAAGCAGGGNCAITINANSSVTANFTLNTYTVTANPSGATTGTVTITSNTGGVNCTWNGTAQGGTCTSGAIISGTSVTLTAALPAGTVIAWGAGCNVTTATTCIIISLTANTTISPVTSIATFTVTTAATNGTITSTNNPTVNYGSTTTVTGSANAGYYFTGVSGCSGTAQNNTNQSITTFSFTTGAITGNCTVTATFAIKTYTLTYTTVANGSITGTSPQTVNHGSNGTAVTAVPNTGYHFVNWSDGSTANPRTDTNVTSDITVTANFAINTYTVTTTATNGTITSPLNPTVNHGSTTTVTGSANANYYFSSVSGCGGTAQTNTDQSITTFSYTTGAITSNCTVAATFEILGSSNTGEGLTGTITASPNPVYQGKDETITYTVTNNGNEDIANLNVKVLIVNPDTQEIKAELNSRHSLNRGGTIAEVRTLSTSNLASKTYLAILQAYTSTMPAPKTLASTTFEVKPFLEVTKTIPDIKNVLVWLNYPWQSGQNIPDRSLIEKALKEAGVTYHIVLDKKDFEKELRNQYYTDFLILGDHNLVEDHFSEELREQVYSGKGLVSSLFNRQNLDSDVFGIKFTGHLSDRDYPVEMSESEISASGIFQSYGRALKVETLNPQNNIGWIVESTNKGTTKYPGVVKRQYGDGKVLLFAFDLGISSTNYSQFASLLKNSLSYIHNPLDTTAAFHPDQFVSVEIKLKSLGGAFDLRIKETYPAELKLYDPITGIWITDNPWTTNVQLSANETKTMIYYALTPDRAGTYTLKTEVGYMDNGVYNPYQVVSTDMSVEKNAVTMNNDIITALNMLSVSGQEKAKLDNAIMYMKNIQGRTIVTDADIDRNIQDILKAINSILSITSADVTSIRLMMDELLKVWEGRWYF